MSFHGERLKIGKYVKIRGWYHNNDSGQAVGEEFIGTKCKITAYIGNGKWGVKSLDGKPMPMLKTVFTARQLKRIKKPINHGIINIKEEDLK